MAYELTWDLVNEVAVDIKDDLADFTTAEQSVVIDHATNWVPEVRYGTDTLIARQYFAAHLATINYGPPAGEGTQNNIGIDSFSSSVTLAVNNPTAKQGLLATVYGRHFYMIQQAHFDGFYVG